MNEVPWQEQVETDGYMGALSWLITQTRPEGGEPHTVLAESSQKT